MSRNTCLKCGKVLITIDDQLPWEGPTWDGTSIQDVCGFGSKHDMDQITFWLCDECITQGKEDGIIESVDTCIAINAACVKEDSMVSKV